MGYKLTEWSGWSPPPLILELDLCASCQLNAEVGVLDYEVTLHPTFLDLTLMNPNMYNNFLNLNTSPHLPSFSFLLWNVRGARNPDFRKVFRNLINTHKPDLIVLTETRLSGDRAHNVVNELGYRDFYIVDAMGFAGGIWMLWDPNTVSVDIIASSFQEVHSHIKVQHTSFLLTAIYASPHYDIRKIIWDKLGSLSSSLIILWLLMGDFNDISNRNEKFGGCPPNPRKMFLFNQFLNRGNLIDLGFKGPKYTWTNCRENNRLIKTRIERFHANPDWISMYPNSKVFHLPRVRSDHCPLLLSTQPNRCTGPKPFRLELFWIKHPLFLPNFINWWDTNSSDIDKNISSFTKNVVSWSKVNFENILKKRTILKRLAGI